MVEYKNEDRDDVQLAVDSRGVAVMTLNRPEKHNAFDNKMIALMLAKLEEVSTNPSARILVLAANGKSFSSGADLNWMKNAASFSIEENIEDAKQLAKLLQILNSLGLPTIARVQGFVCGGALGLLCCCDIVVASPLAKFALSEVKIGLIPAVISPYVIAVLGERHARRYFLTAESLSTSRALEVGLVSEVVAEENLDEAVNKFIDRLLQNSPAAIDESKKLISHVVNSPLDEELISTTSEWIAKVRVSEQGQEGLRAFLEKRSPVWSKSVIPQENE